MEHPLLMWSRFLVFDLYFAYFCNYLSRTLAFELLAAVLEMKVGFHSRRSQGKQKTRTHRIWQKI
jgi:hypothetical protein